MMRRTLAMLVLITAGAVVAAHERTQVPADTFSVVLERNGSTWSLECAEGCPFKRASVTVERPGTRMRLDNLGIRTLASPQPSDVRFGFTLTPRGNGWAAVSVTGTKWTEVSVDCPSTPCRTTVTEQGVGVGGNRR
jgi:hypothetical protein